MKRTWITGILLGILLGISAPYASLAAADPLVITVVFTNDVHGGIDRTPARFLNDEFPPPLGGGSSAAGIIFALREQAQQSGQGFLLLDVGDIFSGTLLGSETGGRAIVDYMNAVGYDAWAIGNHEFDQGEDNLRRIAGWAKFPVLSANTIVDSLNRVPDYLQSYAIKEVGGLKVAFIGLVTHGTPQAATPANIAGLRFDDEVARAQEAIAQARAAGAEFIIGLVHLGLPYDREDGYHRLLEREKDGFPGFGANNTMELVRRVPGLDVVFSGHIHVGYREPWVDPVTHTPCFQNYGRGSGIGITRLKVDRQTNKLIGWEAPTDDGALLTLFLEEFPPDPKIDSMILKEAGALAEVYSRAIGYAATNITRSGDGETPLGNLITDAWCDQTGADLALTNTGGIRDDLPPGDITLQQVFNVLPFSNALVVMSVKGSFIKELFENKLSSERIGFALSGVRLTIDSSQPGGQRIVDLEIGGNPVEPEKTYRLVTTSYLREGNSRFDALADVADDNVSYSGLLERDALAAYIAKLKEIKPVMDGRIKVIKPAP